MKLEDDPGEGIPRNTKYHSSRKDTNGLRQLFNEIVQAVENPPSSTLYLRRTNRVLRRGNIPGVMARIWGVLDLRNTSSNLYPIRQHRSRQRSCATSPPQQRNQNDSPGSPAISDAETSNSVGQAFRTKGCVEKREIDVLEEGNSSSIGLPCRSLIVSQDPPKVGSVHGEELPFVFGAPLVNGFGHFPRNYTKSEVALSESIVQYFANFVRTGNPNAIDHHGRNDTLLPVSKEKSRFRSLTWDQYDPVHQRYLEISE
ncbi:hypothetical protein KM043_014019 [Ampulex compressa]|nr:hypothetical protein KM043_014019 [Ampulex compressa]